MNNKEDEVYQYPQEELIGADAEPLDESATVEVSTGDNDSESAGIVKNHKFSHIIAAVTKACQTSYFKRGGILLLVLIVFGFLGPKIYSRMQNGSGHIVAAAQASSSSTANSNNTDNASLDSINNASSVNQAVINKSAAQVSSMASQMQSLKANVNSLYKTQQNNMRAQAKYQQMMLDLMQQMVEQQHLVAEKADATTVKKLSKSASKELIATIKKQMQKPMHYKVQGVVPGLAWLVDQNGHTTTVRVGDKIAGYGKVSSIDADKCVVITTSGKVIKQDA